MARLASSAAAVATLAVLAAVLALASAQQPDLVASARQANVINVQFFADANFQQVKTPFAYYNFPAISAGSCSACEDFPVSQAKPPRMIFIVMLTGDSSILRTECKSAEGLHRIAGCSDTMGFCCNSILPHWWRGLPGIPPFHSISPRKISGEEWPTICKGAIM